MFLCNLCKVATFFCLKFKVSTMNNTKFCSALLKANLLNCENSIANVVF